MESETSSGGESKVLEVALCSNCFTDQGLKLDSCKIGVADNTLCPNCGTKDGKKLDKELLGTLEHRFFVRGTLHRDRYGGAPAVVSNEGHYQKTTIVVSKWLRKDLKLIEEALKIGFFHYGPRLWMLGEVEPLKALQRVGERGEVIQRILREYPARTFSENTRFFRLRKKPDNPARADEYDSPPLSITGKGPLDSTKLPVLYGSQDLEICVHECRVTVEDEIFLATLSPTRELKLLDLTELIQEETTEFESLDMAIHMLFLAGEHSYEISREIASVAHESGFDELIYPSYFSLVRTGATPFQTVYGISVRRFPFYTRHAKSQVIPNIAIFGRPIEQGSVKVDCINRVILNKAEYDLQFGPVEY